MSWKHVSDGTPDPLVDVIVAHLDETGEYTWEIAFLDKNGDWRASYYDAKRMHHVHYWAEIPEPPSYAAGQIHDP